MPNKKKYNLLILFTKYLVLAISVYFIFQKLKNIHVDLAQVSDQIFSADKMFYWLLAFIFIFFNWALEAFKWKVLVSFFEKITFYQSLKAVCTGIFFSLFFNFFLPGRSGDFMGRILHLHNANRWKGFSSSLLGSLAQTIVTVFAAFIGFTIVYAYQFKHIIETDFQIYLLLILGIISIALLIFYVNIHYFMDKFSKYKWAKNKINTEVNSGTLWQLLLISSLRYLVFITQLWFIIQVLSIEISLVELYAAISIIFLVQTFLPTNFVAEIGIRMATSIYFFSSFASSDLIASLPMLLLWIINILIPSLFGLVYFMFVKFNYRNAAV